MSTTDLAQPTRPTSAGSDSRTALLDATLAIATARGYAGTRISEVRKQTGVSASSLYWHFKNKDDLVAAALTHGYEKWSATHQPRADRSLVERLSASGTAVGAESAFWRLGLMLAFEDGPGLSSEPRQRFLAIRARALATMESNWRHSHPQASPSAIAHLTRLTMAVMDGLYASHLADDADLVAAVVPALAHGLTRLADDLSAEGIAGDLAQPEVRPSAPAPTLTTPPDSRLLLLRAASAVAADSGYTGASIARICAQAGLPASSLYWHFKNKDELFEAVVQHSYDEWRAGLPARRTPAPGEPWTNALQINVASALRSFEDKPDYWRLGCLLLLQQTPEPTRARERFLAIRHQTHADLSTWFESALDAPCSGLTPAAMSLVVLLISDGLHFSLRLDDRPWEPALLAGLTARLVSHAVEAFDLTTSHSA